MTFDVLCSALLLKHCKGVFVAISTSSPAAPSMDCDSITYGQLLSVKLYAGYWSISM